MKQQILGSSERLVTNQIEEKNRTGRLNILNSPLSTNEQMETKNAQRPMQIFPVTTSNMDRAEQPADWS